jgi:hypothetical protein
LHCVLFFTALSFFLLIYVYIKKQRFLKLQIVHAFLGVRPKNTVFIFSLSIANFVFPFKKLQKSLIRAIFSTEIGHYGRQNVQDFRLISYLKEHLRKNVPKKVIPLFQTLSPPKKVSLGLTIFHWGFAKTFLQIRDQHISLDFLTPKLTYFEKKYFRLGCHVIVTKIGNPQYKG